MWVVKLGGSLNASPQLPAWLNLLAELGGGRVAVVAGGGGFADVARHLQAQWRTDDVSAHNMAVLAMAQSALLMRAIEPRLVPAASEDAIRAALHAGRSALWMPFEVLREQYDELTSWDVSGDSLALRLARRLNAERLVVVKSCEVDPSLGWRELSARGVLDARFPAWAEDASCAIDVLPIEASAQLRDQLIGTAGVRSG
jgi:5-(aminomethyl)-3-furanmethanol phosphate kinase